MMIKKTLLSLAIASLAVVGGIAVATDMASPPNSLVVSDTGDVGVNTETPTADLHVVGDGLGETEEILRLESSVPPRITMVNNTSDRSWSIAMTGGNALNVMYLENRRRATFFKNGDMYLVGTLTQGSDRNNKQAIVPVDSVSVLEIVAKLPVSTWEYKGQGGVKHLGPMAQDFHAAFGLGNDPKGLSSIDTGGVALAAIKGLNQVVLEKEARISAQEQQIEQLKQRLTRMEAQQERLSQLEELLRDLTVNGEVAQR